MSGIYASPAVEHGKTVWYIKSTDSHKILSKGRTLIAAIRKFEDETPKENDPHSYQDNTEVTNTP